MDEQVALLRLDESVPGVPLVPLDAPMWHLSLPCRLLDDDWITHHDGAALDDRAEDTGTPVGRERVLQTGRHAVHHLARIGLAVHLDQDRPDAKLPAEGIGQVQPAD